MDTRYLPYAENQMRQLEEQFFMIDCELPVGDIVLAKINPSFDKITVIPGEIEKYVQFPDTDARNASLLHYNNGEKVMEELPSHHQMIISGKQKAGIMQIAILVFALVLAIAVRQFGKKET